jgi:hypothetical protein
MKKSEGNDSMIDEDKINITPAALGHVCNIEARTNEEFIEKLIFMLMLGVRTIIFETQYTKHFIEVRSYVDRGKLLWFAESKPELFQLFDSDLNDDDKNNARGSHVDSADFFPRIYFLAESLQGEILSWLDCRNLIITSLTEWKDEALEPFINNPQEKRQ